MSEPTEQPFSPALKSAIQSIREQASQRINQVLQEQAKHLDLPDQGEVNLQREVWVIPAESDNEAVDTD